MTTHSRESALTPREFELLLEGAQRIEKPLQRQEAQFAVLIMGRLGLRAGELIHMSEDWINWRNRRIEIPRQDDCTIGKHSTVCGYCSQLGDQMVRVYNESDEPISRARERFINRHLDRHWERGDELTKEDVLELRWFAKTESANREVPFGHDARVELAVERFFEDRDAWNRSKSALNRRLNKALRKADELEEDATMPHGLRSTAATWHAGRGVQALTLQSLLGWSDFQTAKRYISDSPDQTERALRQVHSI